ncbi:transposase [Gordonia sp. NPDC003376]
MIDTGRTIAEVAREIGVGEQLLGRWVAVERARMDETAPAVDADERAGSERLRREVAELRMDREFLEKQQPSLRRKRRTRASVRSDRRGEGVFSCCPGLRVVGCVSVGVYEWQARRDSPPTPRLGLVDVAHVLSMLLKECVFQVQRREIEVWWRGEMTDVGVAGTDRRVASRHVEWETDSAGTDRGA